MSGYSAPPATIGPADQMQTPVPQQLDPGSYVADSGDLVVDGREVVATVSFADGGTAPTEQQLAKTILLILAKYPQILQAVKEWLGVIIKPKPGRTKNRANNWAVRYETKRLMQMLPPSFQDAVALYVAGADPLGLSREGELVYLALEVEDLLWELADGSILEEILDD